jgi:hypothetical protein
MNEFKRLICIAEGTYKITKGKTYEDGAVGSFSGIPINFANIQTHNYWIRDDEGQLQLISKDFFKTQQEIREEKLNKLGIY